MKEDDKERWYRNFSIGGVTDYILTEDMEKFDEVFEIVKGVKVPKGNDDKYKNALINQNVDWDNPEFDWELAFVESGIKRPKKFEDYIESYDYSWINFYKYKKLKEKEGKIVILEEDLELGKQLVENVRNSKCKDYFFRNEEGVYENLGQVEIFGVINECWCKIKIDRLILDFEKKLITLIDAKTVADYSSNFEFMMSMFKYGYQANWYVKVFSEAENQSSNIPGLVEKIQKLLSEGFTIDDHFIFVIIPKNNSAVLDCFYKVGNEDILKDINLAMEMYKVCLKNGKLPNKQNYIESIDRWVIN